MKIVFIGAVEFSKVTLEHLIYLNANIVGVCTSEKSDFNSDHFDLSHACKFHKIPYIHTSDINSSESIGWIRDKKPDVIFCFGWSRIIRASLLNLPRIGVIGFHPSALPLNRGRHPIIWSLVLGLKKTGTTFFLMDEGVDSGDIISQQEIKIQDNDDAGSLYNKIIENALVQIEAFLPLLYLGTFERIKQDIALSNQWRKRSKIDGEIDWRMNAVSINNLVRGLTKPYGGAHFLFKKNEFKVWKCSVIENPSENFEPGKVIEKTEHGIVIKCGEGAICLLETEPKFNAKVGDYL
jgi:methionyl-tRNA formyltransferase